MLESLARGAEFAEILRGYVDRATAPLLARIEQLEARQPERGEAGADGADASDEQVSRAVEVWLSANPPAAGRDGVDGAPGLDGKDGAPGADGRDGANGRDGVDGVGLAGALIDRDGGLVLTLSDGTTRDLGRVVGVDGEAGAQGDRGEPGPRGDAGERGERGFDLDDFETEVSEDGRTLYLKFIRDDVAEVHEVPLPEGAPGKDGAGFSVRGTYDAETEYGAGDIVMLNGASFAALSDDPGECPGPGWQLWARQGKPGQKGDKGDRGERGAAGATAQPLGFRVDAERLELGLVLDTGDVVIADLYPLAEVIRSTR